MNILFIIALTFPVAVASTAFSVQNKKEWGRNIMFALILAIGQGVMYYLGDMLGSTFMHLMERISKWIVFALCFSIFYRMLMNTLKIKNGENLYFVQNIKHVLLLSVALGVNAFIAGLMTEFYEPFQNITPYLLIGVAFVWSLISMVIPFSKMRLTFYSLLNLISAFVMLLTGFMSVL